MTAVHPSHLQAGIDRLGADPEFEDIHAALSTPIDESGMTRRRFLLGSLAVGGATMLTVGPMAKAARAAEALTAADPILIVIMLGGGNDGLNMVVPVNDPTYQAMRPNISVTTGAHDLGADGLFFHPSMPKLAARYAQKKVAVVRGVGNTDLDHSHFTSMSTWMAGRSDRDRTTGWLGRYLDGIADAPAGFRAVTTDGAVPLHLLGSRAQVSALGANKPFGSGRTSGSDVALFEAIRAYGAQPSGLGRLGDAIGALDRSSIDRAREFGPVAGQPVAGAPLTRQLRTAASLINLNVGTKVIGATLSSFDTHRSQRLSHSLLLADLDAAIDAFYATLEPQWASQVVLMTFSEFGRRAGDNGSGTDHGTSAPHLVIGDRVRGGMYGTQPSLTDLDPRGDLWVTTDFRSLYASVLGGWLGVDPKPVLGADYPDLDLFTSRPMPVPSGPVPPKDTRFAPFNDAGAFVHQMYADFFDQVPSDQWLATWKTRLLSGEYSIDRALSEFYLLSGYVWQGIDVARMGRLGTDQVPAYDDLRRWMKLRAAGGSLRDVAAEIVASPGWMVRYGKLWGRDLIVKLHTDVVGTAPSEAYLATWSPRLKADQNVQVADLFVDLTSSSAARSRHDRRAIVATVYAALLRRTPAIKLYNDQWANDLGKGMTVTQLLVQFYKLPEYTRRFT